MKTRIFAAFLSMIVSFAGAFSALASGAPAGSASLAYQNRASNVFVQAVMPALAKRLDQLLAAGPTKIYYRIRADGRVESVRVVSARPNKFVSDTCTSITKSTKFPPIPEAVQREQKKNYLEMSSLIGG
jgi:hypothetical protein